MKLSLKFFIPIVFFSYFFQVSAQTGFHFVNSDQKKQKVSFQLINNLIVIPVEVNGNTLSFILDTGVNKTILFDLTKNDSLSLQNTTNIKLKGLGEGKGVGAILSKRNTLSIKNIKSYDETIYLILKDYFDLSSRMGITIHGIIGYNLLKDLIVNINYNSKKITFYNPKIFRYKKCKKCQTIPFKFYRKKPYINAKLSLDTINNTFTNVKLLVDSGGSDAIWLFENSKEEIKTPKRFFYDILGEGLNGTIYGNRSRIPKFKLGQFEIDNPTVSFLDTTATHSARIFRDRNGSIGGNILKRFKIWIDYPNKKFTLKKTGSFKNGFHYNMSGLDVIYHGKQLVKQEDKKKFNGFYSNTETEGTDTFSFVTTYSFVFKPSFKVKSVTKNSPAYIAGVLKDDIILEINGTPTHELTINDIIYKFREKPGKKIKIKVDRNGEKIDFKFRLERKI
mgnify:CR=1 FL=1